MSKLVKAKDLNKGDTIVLVDETTATVSEVKQGDRSPFGQIRGVKFCQPNPITIYFKDSAGEKGYAVIGAATEVEVSVD